MSRLNHAVDRTDVLKADNADLQLSTTRFFDGIEQRHLEEIVAAAEYRRAVPKELIIAAGDAAGQLFLVVKGNARYYRLTKTGDEVLLRWLVRGDVFGLGTLLKDPPAYIGSAEALSECELLVWKHTSIRHLAGLYPQLCENALRIVLEYLKNYSDRHLNLTSKTAGQRLAESLLNLASQQGRTGSEGVEIDATNEQLGSFADISSFTASRLLNQWERQGAVSKRRGKVLIRTPEALVID